VRAEVRAPVTAVEQIKARAAAAVAVAVAGLRKNYGTVPAVGGVSFSVARGEVFALLGPNGAGKTTTLEILEGFRRRDAGRVEVLGLDPGERADGRALRERIGLVLQDIAVEPYLTVRETIARNAGYYPAPRDVDEVIGRCGLAGRVAIIAGGQIVAEGTPSSLGGRDTARARVRFALPAGCTPGDLPPAALLGGTVLDGAAPGGGVLGADADDGLVTVETADPTRALHRLTGWALQRGAVLDRLTVQRPSLEDTYLRLTGQDGRETR